MDSLQKSLVLLGGFISYALADGYTYSVGVFYSYLLKEFNVSSSSTAILPGLLYAVPQLTAFVLCPLLETFGYSFGSAWGSLLLSLSCVASAFLPRLELLYITLGVLASVGLQLVYSSAIMAVTAAFKDANIFGLALGLMMCGSGLGSFAFNPFLAWLLDTWTWRGAMIIQGAILLHCLIPAACFHHVDAFQWIHKDMCIVTTRGRSETQLERLAWDRENTNIENQPIHDTFSTVPRANFQTSSPRKSGLMVRFRAFLRYVVCIPIHIRFPPTVHTHSEYRASQPSLLDEDFNQSPSPDSRGCAQFSHACFANLRQMLSNKIWKNWTLLVYILSNGLIGAAVVIPWTFMYDYVTVSLGELDGFENYNTEQIAWLPSLIGIGSLVGQLTFGFITSQFGTKKSCQCLSCNAISLNTPSWSPCNYLRSLYQDKRRFHLALFTLVGVWISLFTLLVALLPLDNVLHSTNADGSFFGCAIGQVMCAACLLLGFSFGAVYVLYPQILLDLGGEDLWAASLGLLLAVNGSMNLIGTSAGGHIYDRFGSYYGAFILASCFSIASAILITVQRNVPCFKD